MLPASTPFDRVAFVSTRISGTDGVSLEIGKWAEVLSNMGMKCFYIAGKSDRPADQTVILEEAYFHHPAIREINRQAFGFERRSEDLTMAILDVAHHLRKGLLAAVDDIRPDLLIAENCLTIPMNIPLGLAMLQLIQQTGIACIAHHHDFVWERERFLINCVDDFIAAAFPPPLRQIHHVVINHQAREDFSRRTGLPCSIVPNIMDFDQPPSPPDPSALAFRDAVGMSPDDLLILQPTRVVARKAIERSIELVRRLEDPRAKLVITHAAGDEGLEYQNYLKTFADMLGVEVIFAADKIREDAPTSAAEATFYSMKDIYPQADLVTYPSTYEGFGNAFLEAIYYRQPIVCNRYAIYRTDIEPTGMRPITFDGFLTPSVLTEVRKVLSDTAYREEMVDHNYEVAKRHFGYAILEDHLRVNLHRASTCSKGC